MDRRKFIKISAAASSTFAMPIWMQGKLKNAMASTAGPNVLFISIDDMNDWVGCLGGHPQAYTPNIDRLAQMGTLFRNAHCTAPVCRASRTSTLTGLRPSTIGCYRNASKPFREYLPDIVTLPQLFRTVGYDVLGTGKIFHEGLDKKSFDEYYPEIGIRPVGAGLSREEGYQYPKNPVSGVWDWGSMGEVSEEETSDGKMADWAISKLNQKRDNPLFLAVGFYLPHVPWYVPQKYFDRFPIEEVVLPAVYPSRSCQPWQLWCHLKEFIRPKDLEDIPKGGLNLTNKAVHRKIKKNEIWRPAVQAYLASISFTDFLVGKLIDALEAGENINTSNTIVVLWTDHGWHLGEKFRWMKNSLWEEATRVPLIIRRPGLNDQPGICDQPTSLLDLYPTVIELCGLEAPHSLEGNSLVPQLDDPTLPHAPVVTTWRFGNHAIRSERWRYIRYRDGGEELYDHWNDPNEWHNLSTEKAFRDVKMELAQYLPKQNLKERR